VPSTPAKSLIVALALVMATGCAVQQQQTRFSPLSSQQISRPARLQQQIDIRLNTGYSRSLKGGSLWTDIGSVSEGEVYKPFQDVFTLEGAHIHEAYLVVANNTLTGFYLPAEQTFSPLDQKVSINLNKQEQ
jgi:hypothetical protein